ncbi:MAG: hypothetical protein UV51_C0008G0023 [Candidatus Woesebacteria bacterium GW2011_GWC1_42_9]|nr:MAG: hypothetical protein UV51_C0008G0023 [Candidatus Woesebacteria bacterium GW2011_GWC1_42_9]
MDPNTDIQNPFIANAPASSSGASAPITPQPLGVVQTPPPPEKKFKFPKKIILIVLFLMILLAGGYFIFTRFFGKSSQDARIPGQSPKCHNFL